MRRGEIEIVVGGGGTPSRGDLGGDVDSDTLRPLAVVAGRGVVVVLPVVTGFSVVRGVTHVVVVFVVVGGTDRVDTGTTGSERMRRGGIEKVLGREGTFGRGDLGGDEDSDTLRPLVMVTGRGVVGSVVNALAVVVVAGCTVVTGVTFAVVGVEVVTAGTAGSERMRLGDT